MDSTITLILPRGVVIHILDGLYQRLEAWKYTENFLKTELADDRYWPEECSEPAEAHAIARNYEEAIELIKKQVIDRE